MTEAALPRRPVQLLSDYDHAVAPATVVAESQALLAAAGSDGRETVRLYRVTPCVAFGPADVQSSGYPRAVEAARALGFETVARVEGGRAIAADADTLVVAWTIPGTDGRARIRPRFSLFAQLIAEALAALGVDARVGGVPGEYCPGDFTVNARDEVKLVGLGQRVTAGAAHLGAFVVIDGAPRLRAVLTEVYDALGLAWEPRSLGSVAGEVGGTVAVPDVARTVIEALARRVDLRPGSSHIAATVGAVGGEA